MEMGKWGDYDKYLILADNSHGKHKIKDTYESFLNYKIVMDVVKASPHRVKPPCPYYGPCSGCQWQHISYSFQLKINKI